MDIFFSQEAFYNKGKHGIPASGYLEEHLRYVRKRMQAKPKGKILNLKK